MSNILRKIIKSWANTKGVIYSIDEIKNWIEKINENTYVNIHESSLKDDKFWFYDERNGEVLNIKQSFFSIKGIRYFEEGSFIKEQPIIIQPEIGYLGIICKEIKGVLHFLLQAKIEPGNINCVQISPTIQATKSNFTRVHGGNYPPYFDYFINSKKHHVIYDQIQSEQGGRFYKKRNRNMIMLIDDDIDVLPNFCWMTLGQIKELMKIDNLVNMDTRTVISGLPIFGTRLKNREIEELSNYFEDKAFCSSIFVSDPIEEIPKAYGIINDYKMFRNAKTILVPLFQLVNWEISDYGIISNKPADYSVGYYDIEISGREVIHWTQPLIKASGMATFGLLTTVIGGCRKYLVKIKPEIGFYDSVELGPSVQWEPTHLLEEDDIVERLFRNKLKSNIGFVCDVVLSEEGGRFYHEQNRNVVINIEENELRDLPTGYIWVSYSTLNYLIQINNCLNIQLRNLLSLLNI